MSLGLEHSRRLVLASLAEPTARDEHAARLPKIEVDQIIPRLWLGSAPEVGRAVADAGVTLLVLAADSYQPPADSFPGVTVVRAPLGDGPSVEPEDWVCAREAASAVANEHRRGGTVLVTCVAGQNRSGLIVALALYELALGAMSMGAIIEAVQERRRDVLTNEAFVELLRAAERSTRHIA